MYLRPAENRFLACARSAGCEYKICASCYVFKFMEQEIMFKTRRQKYHKKLNLAEQQCAVFDPDYEFVPIEPQEGPEEL